LFECLTISKAAQTGQSTLYRVPNVPKLRRLDSLRYVADWTVYATWAES